MKSDKEIKKEFKVIASQKPEKYYPVKSLKELGFQRGRCSKCHTYFWSLEKRDVCGDAACVGGFTFIGNSPAKRKLTYTQTWEDFAKIHKKLGYTPISRYPVVARWRDDVYWVNAGIYNFQPYVVSGEVKPPANPVVEPQFCLRFNDIDNVGITGAHYVGFVMLGEHAFMPPEKFNFNQYLKDHLEWINKGMGLANRHLVLHEDVWAGGGNFGSSMEFFSGGLELGNQVYITHEVTSSGSQELKLKVLDMGGGMERVPWFTFGKATSYETTFPSVIRKLREETGVKFDSDLVKKFMPYAAWLNVDEVDDINKAWSRVGKKVGMGVKELREKILPQMALYSIAEHSRALLVALNDGALPSNVGGGYNLRVILRRALSFIDKYKWNLYLPDICKWHALELKKLFPELRENLSDVRKILDVEKNKYEATRQKSREMVSRIIKMRLDEKKLLELYDSKGITPEILREEGEKVGVKIKVPDNFYAKVAALHEKREKVVVKREKKYNIEVAETKPLYFDDWSKDNFSGKVLWMKGQYVVLDKTVFYPRSGGQENDTGILAGGEVVDVFKQGGWIVHKLKTKADFKVGFVVKGKIDLIRRKQLTQHHTAAHIINAAARKVLGNHINQAGAKKSVEKGHLDITHYESLTDDEVIKIQDEANKIVAMKLPVISIFMGRDEAEKKFGMRIYQGGAVPGKTLRIVEIADTEAEACGGTHLKNTSEAEEIKVVGAFKIADDTVRIEYKAGEAAKKEEEKLSGLGGDIAKLAKKMSVEVEVNEDYLKMAADEFSVPMNQLLGAFEKFIGMVDENARKLEKVKFPLKMTLFEFARELFKVWKKQKKGLEKKSKENLGKKLGEIKEKSVMEVDLDANEMRKMAEGFGKILLLNSSGNFVFKGPDKLFEKFLIDFLAKGGGKVIKQGMVDKKKIKVILGKFKF
ncbi:MAG: alanine--tRNA ligase [Nanoarchaeota archaeon]|nr:alanine--tRNA ligase [Nanoarchaeota archaeon]